MKKCENCGKNFKGLKKRKYCSHPCSLEDNIKTNTFFQKGHGFLPAILEKFSGKKSYQWKGKNVGYSALHHWIRKQFGKPKICAYCGKRGKFVGKIKKTWNIQWANKGKYTRSISDYLGLCARCHSCFDKKNAHKPER